MDMINKMISIGNWGAAAEHMMKLAENGAISSLTFDQFYKSYALVASPNAESLPEAMANLERTQIGKRMQQVHLAMPTLARAAQLQNAGDTFIKFDAAATFANTGSAKRIVNLARNPTKARRTSGTLAKAMIPIGRSTRSPRSTARSIPSKGSATRKR